jgi:hypothetical protein
MVLDLLLVLVVVLAGVLIVAARRPDDFRVERRRLIKASPEAIFPFVNDFTLWPQWSPWEVLDPSMTRTLGAVTAGVGASYAWSGNGKVGAGRMDIEQSEPSSHIHLRLEFLKPFKGVNTTDFHFNPLEGATEVVWIMAGKSAFPVKVMGLFMNMDTMIGKSFEDGLAKLASLVES